MSEVLRDYTEKPLAPSRPSMKIIGGLATGEALGMIKKNSERYVAKFWGVDLGPSIAPLTNDMPTKMLWLQKTLRTMPELEPKLYQSAQLPITKLIQMSKRTQSHQLRLADKQKESTHIPLIEAFQVPEIKMEVLDSYRTLGDPVCYTIEVFEQWRLRNKSNIDSTHLEIGRQAFEAFIFGHHNTDIEDKISRSATHMVVKSLMRLY